jgi:hypothetical protein
MLSTLTPAPHWMPAMTSDLDAKGPRVHFNERNPERDNPGTQAAPQPGNDPSGIAARLLRLAQQFEDQHAPMTMTLLLRVAAIRLSNHRAETLEYLGQVGQLSDELERLRAALFEIAGMHELSVYDYSPTTRWWMHQKVALDALGVTRAELEESL